MKILVISVHPDDETIGCGGTILKHNQNGDDLYWLIITKTTEDLGFSEEMIREEELQQKEVSKAYGFKEIIELGFPAAQLHKVNFNEILKGLSDAIHRIKPEIIYTVNRSDIHTDHQISAKAVMSCTKSFRYPFIKKILMYECISETEAAPQLPENIFVPNVFSDISDFIDKKIEVMKLYAYEIQESPLPRSAENIKALAKYRGSSVCVHYAEAFMLVREII